MFAKDFRDLIQIFNDTGVEYLLVGGYAFGVYAQPRATKDLDLFIRSSVRNSEAIFRALCAFGAPLQGMTTEDFRDGESGFEFGHEPHRIDILQKISGVTFEEAWEGRVRATIGTDIPICILSREHLIQNKRAAGRPRDLLDVKEIEKASKDGKTEWPLKRKRARRGAR